MSADMQYVQNASRHVTVNPTLFILDRHSVDQTILHKNNFTSKKIFIFMFRHYYGPYLHVAGKYQFSIPNNLQALNQDKK